MLVDDGRTSLKTTPAPLFLGENFTEELQRVACLILDQSHFPEEYHAPALESVLRTGHILIPMNCLDDQETLLFKLTHEHLHRIMWQDFPNNSAERVKLKDVFEEILQFGRKFPVGLTPDREKKEYDENFENITEATLFYLSPYYDPLDEEEFFVTIFDQSPVSSLIDSEHLSKEEETLTPRVKDIFAIYYDKIRYEASDKAPKLYTKMQEAEEFMRKLAEQAMLKAQEDLEHFSDVL